MSVPIDLNALRAAESLGGLAGEPGAAKEQGQGFSDVLADLVRETDSLGKDSQAKVEDFAAGRVDDVHDVMIAMSKADLSFRMMLEVRNKLVEAYQEVMRIQV